MGTTLDIKLSQEDSSQVAPVVTPTYALQGASSHLMALLDVQKEAVSLGSDLTSVLKLAIEHAQRLTRANGVAVVSGEELYCEAATGTLAAQAGHTLTFLNSQSVDSDVPVRYADVLGDSHFDQTACPLGATRSLLIVPPPSKETLFGLLAVAEPANAFTAEDEFTLQFLVGLINAAQQQDNAVKAKQQALAERDVALSAQQDSEDRLRRIAGAAQEGIWMVDAHCIISYVNLRMAEMLGYSLEEITTHSIFDFIHQASRAEAERAFAQGQQDIPQQLDLCYRRKDGSDLWAIVTINPTRDRAGAFSGVLGMVNDITERKQAEESLEAQAAMLREQAQLIDLAHDAIIIRDMKGTIIFWNHGAETIYGWQREEALGHNASALLQSQMDVPPEEFKTQLTATGHWEGELTRSTRDGQHIVVSSRWALQCDGQNQPLSMIEISNDITSHKRAEARQAAMTRGLHEVLAIADELINCPEVDCLTRRAVELVRERLGVERCGMVLVAEDGEHLLGTYGTDMQGHTTDERANRFPRDNARFSYLETLPEGQRWVLLKDSPQVYWDETKMVRVGRGWQVATPIRSKQGAVGVFFNDAAITGAPLDQVQQELIAVYCSLLGNIIQDKRSEAQVRLLINGARCILWHASVRENESGYLDWKFQMPDAEAANRFLPLAKLPGQLYEEAWGEARLAEDVERMNLNAATALENGKTGYTHEFRIRRADGDVRWLFEDVHIEPLLPKQWSMVGVCTDISELKRAENKLREFAAQLEWSNRELQEFSYVASHDLQEPLRKIQAFGDRLKTKHGDALNDEARDYLDRMQNAARRMQVLINDLLAFSRVTTKTVPFTPIDLRALIQDVLTDLEVRVEQSGGRVEVGELPTIEADPLQMRMLFQNLISNALKFQRAGVAPQVSIQGELLPARETALLSADEEGGVCRIIIEDNGIGFEEKYTERIFTVFQRLHSREEYEGTGIGLAICRKIIERHGGQITAQSVPGQGTKFIMMLPALQPKPTS